MSRSRLALALTAVAALFATPAAHARVFYTVAGSFEADTDRDGVDELFHWSFAFSQPGFVTSPENATPSSCSITGAFYLCGATQYLQPYLVGGDNADFISFNLDNADMFGGASLYLFFQPGALGAPGVYSDLLFPLYPGPATLTVSTNIGGVGVPEPTAWALMLTGLGLVGGAMRRRAKIAVTYA
jgi:hypothetical protein